MYAIRHIETLFQNLLETASPSVGPDEEIPEEKEF
jgi:hypothetical protein